MFHLETSAEKWDDYGSYEISWYDKNNTEYHISNAAEFAGLAYIVNNNISSFKGKTIYIDNNINLSGKDWYAFYNCCLSSITIPSSIRGIQDYAFNNVKSNVLYYNTTDPISIRKDIFQLDYYKNVTLYSPEEAMEKIK